jgi:D-xylose transport system substrate-binding protein
LWGRRRRGRNDRWWRRGGSRRRHLWNNYAQPRWAKADGPAIIEAVEAAGGTVIETDANDSSEQQLADVDSLINQGADVLILLAKDAEAILPAVTRATEAGIPVIGYDRLIEDENAFYITFNNEQVGTIMAEEITAVVPEGNYAIVKGHSADPNADFIAEDDHDPRSVPEHQIVAGTTTTTGPRRTRSP